MAAARPSCTFSPVHKEALVKEQSMLDSETSGVEVVMPVAACGEATKVEARRGR